MVECKETPEGVLHIDVDAFKTKFKEYLNQQKESVSCTTIEQLIKIYQKWLYLENKDIPFIEVTIAATLDREIPGDPVWLYVIAPPGGIKTEIIRTLGQAYKNAYTLDTLTSSTFISGLAEKNKETGEWEPIAGMLQDMDGKTLMVKDFTTILTMNEDVRTEIYGQLRSIYDGFFEKQFGTMRKKISVKAKMGLVVGVTPVIDRYTKMQSALGERFLKIRNDPDKLKAARKALHNEGKEEQMRIELLDATKSFLLSLDFTKAPEPSEDQMDWILKLAYYTAFMRTNVWATYDETGRVTDAEVANAEVPTRIAKQFKHLLKLIATIRKHERIENSDLDTIQRVARDTAELKKQSILNFAAGKGLDVWWSQGELVTEVANLYRQNAPNHLQIMESLKILEKKPGDAMNWRVNPDFREFAEAAYTIPGVPLQSKIDVLPPPESLYEDPSQTRMGAALFKLTGMFMELDNEEVISIDTLVDSLKLDGFTDDEGVKLVRALERDGVIWQIHPGRFKRS